MTSVLTAPHRLRRPDLVAVATVFALAAAARIGLVLASSGGIGGDRGYDPAVYYSAADALIHGRLPYADFTLLHPPALMLVLAPFAALGTATTDHVGFVTANLAFALLGASNAALVLVCARRLGAGRGAAWVAGAFYAVWFSAAHPEVSIRLEPLGTAAFLLGLIALAGTPSRRMSVWGGIALGAAVAVKIWWIVPVAVVVGWCVLHRGSRRSVPPALAGLAATLAAIDGPFFLAAPGQMWRMVVTDQLGRQRGLSAGERLASLTSVSDAVHGAGARGAGLVVALVFTAALIALAARVAAGRVVVLVVAVQLFVLLAAPSFFPYYSGYVAAPFAVTVGLAVAGADRRLARAIATVTVTGALAATVVVVAAGAPTISTPFPRGAVAEADENARCVMSDAPGALIDADVLSRDLRNGCPNWVDVTGRTYDVDASTGAHYVPRARNVRWQRDLRRYLTSGRVVLLMRPSTGIGPSLRRVLAQETRVVDSDGVRAYVRLPHDDRDGPGLRAGRRPVRLTGRR